MTALKRTRSVEDGVPNPSSVLGGRRLRLWRNAPRTAPSHCTSAVLFSALFCFLKIKQAQDEERRQLVQLRDILKSALQVEQKEVRGFNFERLLFYVFIPQSRGLRD